MDDFVRRAIAENGGLEPGMVVVHFDLVALVREVREDRELVERKHWAPEGADPHLSYAVLSAQAERLLRRRLIGYPVGSAAGTSD